MNESMPQETVEIMPESFADTVENLQFQKKKVPMQYASTVMELQGMAKGGDGEGIRAEYYPGWSDEHFKKLLEAIGEK